MAETAHSKNPTEQIGSAGVNGLIQGSDESRSRLHLSASYLGAEPNVVPMDAGVCRRVAICLWRPAEGSGSSPLSSRSRSSIPSAEHSGRESRPEVHPDG